MTVPADETAFGVSVKDLARAGRPPVVLLDSLRWLSLKGGLTEAALFSGVGVERKKLVLLKAMYEAGRRPLRAKAAKQSPQTVAELLLLWLSSQPEPLFPSDFMPELLASQQAGAPQAQRVAAIRSLLKQTEPFIVEALFPLFEFLHHWLLNQADREACIQELGRLFAPSVFGPATAYALPEGEAGLLEDITELMILQYRPLFTQPYNLNRYEQDCARLGATLPAAELSPAALGAGVPATPAVEAAADLGAPLLTPLRVGQLSVVDPSGRSPFSVCEDRSPLPPDLAADLLQPWDEEHAELFAADPELSGLMSAMVESAVSAGLGLLDSGSSAGGACALPAPLSRGPPAASKPMHVVMAGSASAAAVAAEAVDRLPEQPLSPTAVLLAAVEQHSDGSGSDSEAPRPASRTPRSASRPSMCLHRTMPPVQASPFA